MAPAPDSAFWLAIAWAAIIAMGVVGAVWRPRHTHPARARCRCVDCVLRREAG